MPDFAPLRMAEVELSGELPPLPGGRGDLGIAYRAAQCLIRLHGRPLGFAQIDLQPGGIGPEMLAGLIWDQLGGEIRRHLEEDGLEVPDDLMAAGLPSVENPRCRQEGEEFLKQAPLVSVVVPTRNRPSSAAQTVNGIAECEYPSDRLEVIVVDNASGDDKRVEPAAIKPGRGGTRPRRFQRPQPRAARGERRCRRLRRRRHRA